MRCRRVFCELFHGRKRNAHEEQQQLPERKECHSHSSFPLTSSSIISNPASAVRVCALSCLRQSGFCLQLALIHHTRPPFCTVPYCPTRAHQNKPSSQILHGVHSVTTVVRCVTAAFSYRKYCRGVPPKKRHGLYNSLCTNVFPRSENTMKVLEQETYEDA